MDFLLVTGHQPRVWVWTVVPNTLSPNLPAGCFLIAGTNRKSTIDGKDIIDFRENNNLRTNNEPETWIRLPVAADFSGFVDSQGEVGGGQMCLNDHGEVFWAVGGYAARSTASGTRTPVPTCRSVSSPRIGTPPGCNVTNNAGMRAGTKIETRTYTWDYSPEVQVATSYGEIFHSC